MKRPRIIIIGGGVSGLTAAYQLTRPTALDTPPEVLLLEASAQFGGTIRTHHRAGFLLEGGPDAFISEKPEALQLVKQLRIEAELIETNDAHRRAFVVRAGKLRAVPEGFQLLAPSRFRSFVTTDIFSWPGKARMALDLVLPKRAGANAEDDESLAEFVRRRFGREALERIAQPMVGGIYTADPEHLSLRATMPRFLDMEREHRSVIKALWRAGKRAGEQQSRSTSGARYSMFLSFKDGMQTLTDKLAAELPPDCVRLNARVEALAFDRETKRWQLSMSGGETLAADAICIALPAHAAAKLLHKVDAEIAAELNEIPYASTATVNLAYRRADIPHPLDGFGFVVPFIEKRATLACSFSSVKFSGRAPENCALLRAFVGGALQPEMFALDEDEMIRAVCEDLRQLLGVERAPIFAHVEKWPRSMAQYHLGHAEKVARIRGRLAQFPMLQLAGNAYSGAGIPDCIRSGRQAAEALLSQFTNK